MSILRTDPNGAKLSTTTSKLTSYEDDFKKTIFRDKKVLKRTYCRSLVEKPKSILKCP